MSETYLYDDDFDDEPGWGMTFGGSGRDPMMDDRMRLSDVGKLARRARRRVVGAARADDRPTLAGVLGEHLGEDVEVLDVVEESWPSYDHVNVQVALDVWLAGEGRTHELMGLANRHHDFGLGDLLKASASPRHMSPVPGNVSWTKLASGPAGKTRRAVRAGLYLVQDADVQAAVLVLGSDPHDGGGVRVHVAADRLGAADAIAADLRRLALEHNVFRGQVVSFDQDMFGERQTAMHFHPRPTITADDVVLPEATLDTIHRQVVGVARHRARLLAARQHLKRGLLLYGPPGVGKTHTVRYLVSQLTGVTIIQLSGNALGMIDTACSVARTLQPAMIVVEDVDLIAEDRGRYPGQHPLLFQLLNEMDGLAQDADVVFLLTTNRADLLEPALAARPGRVDQAVLMELPDVAGRRRLFELYRGGLTVDESRLATVLERTEGVTASFLKELLRRAALIAVADFDTVVEDPLAVSADHLDAALDELLDTRNTMTRVLLGGGRS